jgi:hypothetical protein
MPDGVELGSFLWSNLRFPEPRIESDKNSQLRRPRILAVSIRDPAADADEQLEIHLPVFARLQDNVG